MRTGSVVRPNSESTVESAASASSAASSLATGSGHFRHQQRLGIRRLVVDLDAHVVDHADDGLDLLGIQHVVRQMVVDLGVGEVAPLLAEDDEVLQSRAPGFGVGGGKLAALELLDERALAGGQPARGARLAFDLRAREALLQERFLEGGLVELLRLAGLVLRQELQLREDLGDLLLARRLHAGMRRLGLRCRAQLRLDRQFLARHGPCLDLRFPVLSHAHHPSPRAPKKVRIIPWFGPRSHAGVALQVFVLEAIFGPDQPQLSEPLYVGSRRKHFNQRRLFKSFRSRADCSSGLYAASPPSHPMSPASFANWRRPLLLPVSISRAALG